MFGRYTGWHCNWHREDHLVMLLANGLRSPGNDRTRNRALSDPVGTVHVTSVRSKKELV